MTARWTFGALGVVLGALPFVRVPGLPGSLVLLLVALCWAAVALSRPRPRLTWPVVLSGALVLTGAASLVATGWHGEALADFGRWTIATSFVASALLAGRDVQLLFGRCLAVAATVAAALGVVMLRLDPGNTLLVRLGLAQRDPATGNARTVQFANGRVGDRLTWVWLDPNVAGLLMVIALVLALALLRGRLRVVCAVVLVLGTALTLSRAALGSVALGGLLLVVASGLPPRTRRRIALVGVLLGAALLLVPGVLARLRDSLGGSDVGAHARWAALHDLPAQMAGHWLFGRGWGLRELLDGSVARVSNYPANAPLLTLYRGGLVMAVVFVALLVLLVVRGWRLLRRAEFACAALGAGTLGLVLVALQLDFPVVTMVPAVVALAVLLVFTSPGVPPDRGGA